MRQQVIGTEARIGIDHRDEAARQQDRRRR